ncbi:unnamed protein product [Adineta ricciae]|uniref:F-box domain-containing protein n=1 Tax=Adineta ricciae TaxID=249248 RepID=A0A814KCV3_ADIRI|nr:unnamed protein product [Adineta ricciae]
MFKLLDLPDEILCEILRYLSVFDALFGFLNLNSRLNRLLSPFTGQIDFTSVSYEQFLHYINDILPVISKQGRLYALKLGDRRTPGQIELFNRMITSNTRDYITDIDRVFVEAPCLKDFSHFIDDYLTTLPRLRILSIETETLCDSDFPKWTKVILNSIFPIPSLTKLSIRTPVGPSLSRLSDTLMLYSLTHLTLHVSAVTDLVILIKRTPNLEQLSIRMGWWTSGDRTLVKILDEMRSDHSRTSFLPKLRRFSLTIDSIISFQHEHLQQVLFRILNEHVTSSFSFILRSCIKNDKDSTVQLLDGRLWQQLLSPYSHLRKFYLFIRISDSNNADQQEDYSKTFQSSFFREKKWFFSYLKPSRQNDNILYSIANKTIELFHISLNPPEKFHHFPMNYASHLAIDQTETQYHTLDQSNFYHVLNQFPFLQELTLTDVKLDALPILPINILSLYSLKIEKTQWILPQLLFSIFPLINTLSISFPVFDDQNGIFNSQYNQMKDLSLFNIHPERIKQVSLFLNQFPNISFLHLRLCNRRFNDDSLLNQLKDILRQHSSLISVKLEFDRDFSVPINWTTEFHDRVRMFLSNKTFDGVLYHLWF